MGKVKKMAEWALVFVITSSPSSFFAEELKAILASAHPIVGILAFRILMVLNAFAFEMRARELWKEW